MPYSLKKGYWALRVYLWGSVRFIRTLANAAETTWGPFGHCRGGLNLPGDFQRFEASWRVLNPLGSPEGLC